MNIFARIADMWSNRNNEDNCFGYWAFKPLPTEHPFQRAAVLHDYEFDQAHKLKKDYPKSRAEVDWDLFYRLVLLAKSETNPDKQCDRAMTICRYWPLAREYGNLYWEGKESNIEINNEILDTICYRNDDK
jgi:hypothetical protein